MPALWVFLGGGTGAVLRWLVSTMVRSPWGTLTVNLLGSALLAALLHPRLDVDPTWRLALGTGLLGGFTTYSTFNAEVLSALQAGQPGKAALLGVGTLLSCLIAGAAGYAVVGWFANPP